MIEIQLAKQEQPENKLIVDGITITEDLGYFSSTGTDRLYARIYDYDISKKITDISFNDIPENMWHLEFYHPLNFTEFIETIEVNRDYHNMEHMQLRFNFSWDFEKWKNPFSIEEFAKTMEETVFCYKDRGLKWVQEDEILSNGCHIVCLNFNKSETIKMVVERNLPLIKEIIQKANLLLMEQSNQNSLISLFDFPEQVRVPCEQYLIYFVEFLKNIGIVAITEISHQAGKVLFSVTPESKETALWQIKEALDIYLQLPTNIQKTGLINMYLEPKEQQLIANIQHLNGQLMLANALAQTQNEIIQNQKISIEQQQQIIDSTILQHSLLITTSNDDNRDKEDILGGTISLTNIEAKGFQINLPSIYRWLREKL